MNKYWFVPKSYGYGYVPISIEGGIATIGLILIGVFLAYINNFFNPVNMNYLSALLFLGEVLVLGFVFLKVFEKKCKGKLEWKWGNKK